jgi:hypothetical protein
MSVFTLLLGLAALLFGRQLFWLFVAAAGFFLGFNLGQQFLGPDPFWLATLVGLLAGTAGALLAVFAQRLALALAGFIAGGYLFVFLGSYLGLGSGTESFDLLSVVVFIVGGIIGAALVSIFFDVALILLSAVLGATLTSDYAAGFFGLDSTYQLLLFLGLIAAGIGLQWGLWSERPGRVRDR